MRIPNVTLFVILVAASAAAAPLEGMQPREITLTGKYLLVPVRAFHDPGAKVAEQGKRSDGTRRWYGRS